MSIVNAGQVTTWEFLERAIADTEARLSALGLKKDALLDPEDSYDRQVAILRYHYLISERSALIFKPGDQNFWRMLRARLQPVVLAYLTHEKFVQNLEGDVLKRKLGEMMEIYRDRLATTEQFRELFFEIKEQARQERVIVEESVQDLPEFVEADTDKVDKFDGRSGIADIQANVINQLKDSLKDQERIEKQLRKQLKEKDEQLYRHEKTIERLEKQQHKLLEDVDRLSTENLQLKISIDASRKEAHGGNQAGEIDIPSTKGAAQQAPAPEAHTTAIPDYDNLADASKEELLLKIESLERDLENTSSAAYSAFMANSDLGIVVLFMLSAFKCNSINRLAQEVGRSLKTYGMKSVFRVKTETSTDFFSEDRVADKDKMLIKNHEGEGRFVDLGRNYLIYDERTAILVKSMPLEDEERLGRLKDNLNTLMQGAETSANLIALSQSAEMQKQRMEALLIRSNAVFTKLSANLERNKKAAVNAVEKAATELRTQLRINTGSPHNAKLSAAVQQMESSLQPLFNMDRLVDAAFVKNVARVVEGLKKER
ncbi:MAG: hypothetical protein R3208_20295 [Ketobacteraceae bacterium]|nr:hypothetical protein [Ketobacteraceae bacterium]